MEEKGGWRTALGPTSSRSWPSATAPISPRRVRPASRISSIAVAKGFIRAVDEHTLAFADFAATANTHGRNLAETTAPISS